MVCPMDIRLWRRPASLANVISASTHSHDEVDRLFLEIAEHGDVGFGEVSPLPRTVHPDPSIDHVIDHVTNVTVPRLITYWRRDDALPEWTRIHTWAGGSAPGAWSGALAEMALLDLSLVQSESRLEHAWGVVTSEVPRMATTSLIDADGEWHPPSSATRVRAKVRAGLDPARALDIASQWSLPVLLDFNGGAGDAATVHAWVDAAARRIELVAVEQPFPAGDLAEHTLLARDLDVAVSLDESVTSMAVVRLIARHGAAAIVCVKPPRLGGLAAARHALAEASTLGLRAYVGGFFESPLARRVHAAVAAGAPVEASDVLPVQATSDADDQQRAVGLGTVPSLANATLLTSWENG
jgi:o-succinylbenzoate synthase